MHRSGGDEYYVHARKQIAKVKQSLSKNQGPTNFQQQNQERIVQSYVSSRIRSYTNNGDFVGSLFGNGAQDGELWLHTLPSTLHKPR